MHKSINMVIGYCAILSETALNKAWKGQAWLAGRYGITEESA